MATRKPVESLFDVLEISPAASEEVIRAAHKALMAKYHPDRTGNDERCQQIGEAFNVLSDAKARARYEKEFRNLGGEVVGEYRIVSKIAEGGFGETYKAEHVTIGEPVCIKHCHNLDSFDESILIEEAKIMWDLRHYSVPAIRGMLRMPDRKLALVMSYVPGPTLAQIIEKVFEKSMPRSEHLEWMEHVAWITERVLNALRYIHYQGVVHGDLKPHNVVVEPDKHLASIVDFGLARIKPKSKSGSKGYTEFFSAPEVVDGKTPTPESDFYSLGMTMIYALSGDAEHLLRKEVPAHTPEPLRRFIRRLIVRDPASRPRWPAAPNTHDLWDEFLEVRRESFGKSRSNLKPIPGF